MASLVPVLGPCLAVQLLPLRQSAPPVEVPKTTPKRSHAFYRSLRNRVGVVGASPADTEETQTPVTTGSGGADPSPSSPSSAGSPNAGVTALLGQQISQTLVNKKEQDCVNGSNKISRSISNDEPTEVDVLIESCNRNSQPDVVLQSTSINSGNVSSNNRSGKLCSENVQCSKEMKRLSSESKGNEIERDTVVVTDDEVLLPAMKKSSPARRSSFFHAINSSLPPLSPSTGTIPPSAKVPASKEFPTSPVKVVAGSATPIEGGGVGSTTPTPTNGDGPPMPGPPNTVHRQGQDPNQLFQCWVSTNAACCWDPELVAAMGGLRLLGALMGGWLLVAAPTRSIATLLHAHAHSLLHPPPGYTIAALGEVSGCQMSPVQRVQFTPLGPALCWVLYCEGSQSVSLAALRSALAQHFPLMALPDATTTHAALTDLIRQRKVYHAGRGYSLVTPDTYGACATVPLPPQHPPFRLLSTSEALTKAHGAAEVTRAGAVTHAAVQTDLADLLSQPVLLQQLPGHGTATTANPRRASLRLGRRGQPHTLPTVATYKGRDMTDVTIRAERGGSVLSKLLRVSTPRLASFSAQFPPPEWGRAGAQHRHSRATQTRHAESQTVPDFVLAPAQPWVPRSSTLPRRPTRPLSSASLHCPPLSHALGSNAGPSIEHVVHNESTSSGSSPIHHCRHQSPSPHKQQSDNCGGENMKHVVYANPYRIMAQQERSNHHKDSHQSHTKLAKPVEEIYANYNPYVIHNGLVENGLPPRPPPQSHDITHRRTLSASPRRMAGVSQYAHPSPQKVPLKHSSPHRQHQKCDRNRKPVTRVHMPQEPKSTLYGPIDGGLNRHGLSSSYNAVYDNSVRYHENTMYSASAQNVQYAQPSGHYQRQRHDSSPKRKPHSSSHRTAAGTHQSPSRHLNESADNELLMNDRRRIGNLSSSMDSGILPDQRSSNRDSSEDRTRSLPAGAQPPDNNRNSEAPAYDRAALQLNLVTSHMNNAKKVESSPTKSEAPKNIKILSDINNITKGSTSDLTSKNLGYTDTNKCEKKLYVPHQSTNSIISKQSRNSKISVKHAVSPTKKKVLKSKQESAKYLDKKKSNDKCNNTTQKLDSNKNSSDHGSRGGVPLKLDKVQEPPTGDGGTDSASVRTYPSLSELNFSSLTAQKILRGVSVNSIDTLLEVNMAAGDGGKKLKVVEPVTNTDFGYL